MTRPRRAANHPSGGANEVSPAGPTGVSPVADAPGSPWFISDRHRQALVAAARQADENPSWPTDSWDIARQIGVPAWSIPKRFGGHELTGPELLAHYEQLAATDLTTAFILSQRDAACRRLLAHGSEDLCRELIPKLATGEHFATVGLAQLTTSRQHVKPAVIAKPEQGNWLIDGTIPWVTGAGRAEHIIIGAVSGDKQQILAVLPTDLAGVRIGPPLELAALQGSITAEVQLDGVRLPSKWLLAGPAESVMRSERGGTGGLETSCLALGLTRAAIDHMKSESAARPQLVPIVDRLSETCDPLRKELYALAAGTTTPDATQSLRAQANALVLRATQAALAASKGTGFLRDHPAQRWARQALFFLVWSCPWPVTAATMGDLLGESCDGD